MERRAGVILAITSLVACGTVAAQVEIPRRCLRSTRPRSFSTRSHFWDPGPGDRLDVFVRIGYDNLSFVKTGDTYAASFELEIRIEDSTGTQVIDTMTAENIGGLTFDQSVATSGFSLKQRSFPYRPGGMPCS